MKVTTVKDFQKRPVADALVVPVANDGEQTTLTLSLGDDAPEFGSISVGDFKGKNAEVATEYAPTDREPRTLLLGLGLLNELTPHDLRLASAALIKTMRKAHLRSANVIVPPLDSEFRSYFLSAFVEGVVLANYEYTVRDKGPKHPLVEQIAFIAHGDDEAVIAEAVTVCEATLFARDLVNGNADDITPEALAYHARQLAKDYAAVKVTVMDEVAIAKEGLGLLHAVSRGADKGARLITIAYTGAPESDYRTVLVGKGVTFDSGGLDLKTAAGMEKMRSDMGGAAAVLGAIRAAAEVGLEVNVTGVIPATENSIGPASYKPGDVYRSYSGKTVEIGNTDAEGRLILADALSYAAKNLKPDVMIDIATLTGAVMIALGDEFAGVMASDHVLSDELMHAGRITNEFLWPLPMPQEYESKIESDRADLKNTGGKGGAAIVAGMFLAEFVDGVPWAHLDIAGVRFREEAKSYLPKGANGFGVRLLYQYLKDFGEDI